MTRSRPTTRRWRNNSTRTWPRSALRDKPTTSRQITLSGSWTVPFEDHFRHVANLVLLGWRNPHVELGQAGGRAAIKADEMRMVRLFRMVPAKSEPPDMVAQVSTDRQTNLGQIAQTAKDGRRAEAGLIQPFGNLGMRDRGRRVGQFTEHGHAAGGPPQSRLLAGAGEPRPGSSSS